MRIGLMGQLVEIEAIQSGLCYCEFAKLLLLVLHAGKKGKQKLFFCGEGKSEVALFRQATEVILKKVSTHAESLFTSEGQITKEGGDRGKRREKLNLFCPQTWPEIQSGK